MATQRALLRYIQSKPIYTDIYGNYYQFDKDLSDWVKENMQLDSNGENQSITAFPAYKMIKTKTSQKDKEISFEADKDGNYVDGSYTFNNLPSYVSFLLLTSRLAKLDSEEYVDVKNADKIKEIKESARFSDILFFEETGEIYTHGHKFLDISEETVKGKIDEVLNIEDLKNEIFDKVNESVENKFISSVDAGNFVKKDDTSLAIGTECNANSTGAIAFGYKTIASGNNSFASGYSTTASGSVGSHAEGNNTTASGDASHAEGKTTTASGRYSHAEGLTTVANGSCQHVQGKYNIIDENNDFAHIVGNGEYNDKNNAYALDWNGNGYFAGNNVYVKYNFKDKTGYDRLVSEEDLNSKNYISEELMSLQDGDIRLMLYSIYGEKYLSDEDFSGLNPLVSTTDNNDTSSSSSDLML